MPVLELDSPEVAEVSADPDDVDPVPSTMLVEPLALAVALPVDPVVADATPPVADDDWDEPSVPDSSREYSGFSRAQPTRSARAANAADPFTR